MENPKIEGFFSFPIPETSWSDVWLEVVLFVNAIALMIDEL